MWWLVNAQRARIWKEVVVAQLSCHIGIRLQGLYTTTKNVSTYARFKPANPRIFLKSQNKKKSTSGKQTRAGAVPQVNATCNVWHLLTCRTILATVSLQSIQQKSSWEANWYSATQEIPPHFMEPKGSLSHSQEPVTWLYPETLPLLRLYQRISPVPRPLCMIRNMFMFSRRGAVYTSPNPQAGGPTLVGSPRLLI